MEREDEIRQYIENEYTTKIKRVYTGEDRVKITEEYLRNGGKKTADKYGVPLGTIKKWRRFMGYYGTERLLNMNDSATRNQQLENHPNKKLSYNEGESGNGGFVNTTTTYRGEKRHFPYKYRENKHSKKETGGDGYILGIEPTKVNHTNGNTIKVYTEDEDMLILDDVERENIIQQLPINNADTISTPILQEEPSISIDKHKYSILCPALNDPATASNSHFLKFLAQLELCDMEKFDTALYICELRVQMVFGPLNMVSILFNSEIEENNNGDEIFGVTQQLIEEVFEKYNYTIYLGFGNTGRVLHPVVLVDYPLAGEGLEILRGSFPSQAVIEEEKNYQKNNYEALFREWFSEYVNGVKGKVLIIHSLSHVAIASTKSQLPSRKVHYLNIPPGVSKRIFPFSEFGIPILIRNILSNYFWRPFPRIGIERTAKLIESLLKSLISFPNEIATGCFYNFFQNLMNFKICKQLKE